MKIISEAALDDVRRSQIADRYLTAAMRELYSRTDRLHHIMGPKVRQPILYPSEMGLSGIYGDIALTFTTDAVSYYGRAALLHDNSELHDPDGRKIRYLIILKIDQPDDETKTNRFIYYEISRMRDTFRHEFQHVLDMKRRKIKPDTAGQIKTGTETKHSTAGDYYNSPEELNAYFHNIAEPILDRIRFLTQHGREPVGLREPLPDTYQEYFRQRIPQLFLSHREFWKQLSDANKRKVMKRLARLWDLLKQTRENADK